jgi:two-component system, cell cycle sensor histidine kinase and response regulator CckA
MTNFVSQIFDPTGFPARWHCGAWSPEHGWTHIVSDVLIFAAYMAIPVSIAFFITKRRDMYHSRLYWLFALFIGSCGLGHLIEATIFWYPWYRLSGLLKVVTAAASWATVFALVKVMPSAMKLPGALQLNESLAREIEERKRAEAEVRRLNEALTHRVEELETLLDVIPIAIGIASDPEGKNIRGNQALSSLLRVPAGGNASLSAAKAERPSHFKVMAGGRELAPEELPFQRAAIRDEVIRDFEEEVSFSDGRRLHLLASAAPLRDSSGKVRGSVGALIDISIRKQAEEERSRMETKLRETQKLESLGVLAGGIAHDFNNLLTGIVGNASMARLDCGPGSPLLPYFVQIERSSLHAADLCKQLLAYAGKGRLVVEKVDLAQTVRDTTHLIQSSLNPHIRLSFDLLPVPPVEADAVQLRQVIMNLVINASEAIGSEHGTIHLGTRPITADREYLDQTVGDRDLPPGDYVVLQITDTGAGMDAETKALIFDPFFTTKFTGRGLGLAAVQGIIRAHKGAIKVYSERGKGTTFKILLPAVRGEASPPTDAPESVMKATGSGTVLVIDDDTGVRKTAAKILERAGYSAIEATNGAQGVELFRADKDFIRAVLLDLTMPGMDGEETFRQLRQIKPDVRVILMSGFNEQEAVQRFVGRGLAGFAQKPFSSDILLRRVQSILDSEPPAGI